MFGVGRFGQGNESASILRGMVRPQNAASFARWPGCTYSFSFDFGSYQQLDRGCLFPLGLLPRGATDIS